MHEPLRVAVIVGSTREGRLAPVFANWFLSKARLCEGLQAQLIDLAEAGLPEKLSSTPGPEVTRFADQIAEAEAFVIITPEYNHSFPAPLKTAIDSVSQPWRAKPVGFVSYGGISGGLRAVEQLRQVFAEAHAVTVRDVISFQGAWARFAEDGSLKEPALYERMTRNMLDQLTWWGLALRDARASQAYPA